MLPGPCRKAMGAQEWHARLATSWNQCPLQKFEPYEPRIVLSSHGARLVHFYSRSPRIWHRFPPVHCQVIRKVMLYRIVRQETWLLHACMVWRNTPIATGWSSGSSAWGCCAARVHHCPGLTQCLSQRHNLWWTTLAAGGYEDTPPTHVLTSLWQTNIAKQALAFPDTSGQVSATSEGKFVWLQTAGNSSDERWMAVNGLSLS